MENLIGLMQVFLNDDNPVVVLQSIVNIALCGVVVVQWRHTTTRTVPKWVFDIFVQKTELIAQQTRDTLTILRDRG
jgi:hypothetical protein